MNDRLTILLILYGTLALLALVGMFGVFHDRRDLWSVAWSPMLIVAVVVTPFALWA